MIIQFLTDIHKQRHSMIKAGWFLVIMIMVNHSYAQDWSSKLVWVNADGQLEYAPDEKGGTIPDFSAVGYKFGEVSIPNVPVKVTAEPMSGDARTYLQKKINEVAGLPLDENGFRGALLLKKGEYEVSGTLTIPKSGIVIRGEGNTTDGTVIIETATTQLDLFHVYGSGSRIDDQTSKTAIAENFVPVGRKYVELEDASGFSEGDLVVIFRPGTDNWIHDLKMDQIDEVDGTVQWTGSAYNLYFERIITKIEGNKVYFKNPVVMEMDSAYGGGYLLKCSFPGRINNCGIENLYLKSTYNGSVDENHGWNAIKISTSEDCWVREVTALHFGYSTVNVSGTSKHVSVISVKNIDPISQITGSRRYSFNCDGQLNLFQNCYSSNGRHDYVTGARVCGPNVFTQCSARNTQNDIGPHHRWAVGTLFDVINTSGEINVQDRGNWGTGHGWAGVTQVLWNCKVSGATVQSPWVSGKNYSIGTYGQKLQGRLSGRPDGYWEGQNKTGLTPESLYEAQLSNRKGNKVGIKDVNEGCIQFYPNPCKKELKVNSDNTNINYQFVNLNGTKVLCGNLPGSNETIDVSMLSQGIYILKYSTNSAYHYQKIIVQR